MSIPDGSAGALVNKGFIVMHSATCEAGTNGKTFIVTGLHRSGTTLVASILRAAGLFMGDEINDVVHEDEAIAKVLIARDKSRLRRLIAERNGNYGTWGFKFPMLSRSIEPACIGQFSRPHLIVTFRDPVAVAVRTALSEYQEALAALRVTLEDQAALLSFVDRLTCPVLLLSYEKALVFPGDCIDAILGFCGFPHSAARRETLIRLIEPNRPQYLAQARRRYEGVIDGMAGGSLHGWCRLTGMAPPVALDLLVDDQRVRGLVADLFRQDLLDAGFGSGHHAFAVDLSDVGLNPDQVIRIRVAGRDIELENSGKRLRDFNT